MIEIEKPPRGGEDDATLRYLDRLADDLNYALEVIGSRLASIESRIGKDEKNGGK